MQYLEFKEKFKEFIVFTLADVRKIEPKFYRSRLNEWQKKGYIRKLRRGFYIFADVELNEQALFLIANRLYAPSYVSFEMALSYYGLIPEGVYGITSVTTKKTSRFRTPVGEFIYHRIKPNLLFGYRLETYRGQNYKIAEIEKTLVDYLYINPRLEGEADFFELRFNGREFFSRVDIGKLDQYLAAFNNKRLSRRAKKFLEFIKKQQQNADS